MAIAWEQCTHCTTTGRVSIYEKAQYGEGLVFKETIPCPHCNGTGYLNLKATE